MSKTTDYATMPHTFARQEQTIKRLQGEIDELRTQAENLRKHRIDADAVAEHWMQMHDEVKSELDAANESVNQWMEYYHNAAAELDAAKQRIVELTKAIDTMNERQRKEWARAENAESWAQRAYVQLDGALDTVSAEAEIGIRKLLQDAPEAVKGEAK